MKESPTPNQLSDYSSDLNTRARIRQAAMDEFAKYGFRGASIRGIAKVAGVSPGLVQHHFGTKDGLREACDEYVMESLLQTQQDLLQRDAPRSTQFAPEYFAPLQPMIEYMIMSLSSGSETAAKWFERITEYTYEALMSGRIGPPLDPSLDTRAIAATQAAMALGVNFFYRNIINTLGIEDMSEALIRVGRARLFLASDRVVGPETRANLEAALDQYEKAQATGKPPPSTASQRDHDE